MMFDQFIRLAAESEIDDAGLRYAVQQWRKLENIITYHVKKYNVPPKPEVLDKSNYWEKRARILYNQLSLGL